MKPAMRELVAIAVAFACSVGVVVATRTNEVVRDEAEGDAHHELVTDATGRRVRARRYVRIASSSILVDRIVLELVEPERILGLSRHGYEGSSIVYRYGNRPRIDPSGDLETLIRARPDLLIVSNFVEPGRLARLREAGIEVFDLGQMRGLASLLEDIRTVGALVDEDERAEVLADRMARRMAMVAIDVPMNRRPTAIYVGVHGTQIYGGAAETSYHDVLEAGGLVDVAARTHRGWPSYTGEAILAMDPDYVLSPKGQGRAICRQAGLDSLRACVVPGHIVEIDPRVLVDPGLTMLEAAEAVRLAVHGPPVPLGGTR